MHTQRAVPGARRVRAPPLASRPAALYAFVFVRLRVSVYVYVRVCACVSVCIHVCALLRVFFFFAGELLLHELFCLRT